MALKLSSTVHGTSTGDRERREAPAAVQDSDVGSDHEVYRKSSQFCTHQEVCDKHIPNFRFTLPGKISAHVQSVYTRILKHVSNHGVLVNVDTSF